MTDKTCHLSYTLFIFPNKVLLSSFNCGGLIYVKWVAFNVVTSFYLVCYSLNKKLLLLFYWFNYVRYYVIHFIYRIVHRKAGLVGQRQCLWLWCSSISVSQTVEPHTLYKLFAFQPSTQETSSYSRKQKPRIIPQSRERILLPPTRLSSYKSYHPLLFVSHKLAKRKTA